MAVKHFLLKERVEKGEDQPADMLTKHLARAQFQQLRDIIVNYDGVVPSASTAGVN